MATITGTSGNDTLSGTSDHDLIQGLDGNDILTGGVGNDRLEGGAGTDSLNGGAGNDVLVGGTEDDTLYDNSGGDDELDGGDGRDDIRIWRSASEAATANLMDGGAEADFFGVYDESRASTFDILAGDGNDYFYIRGGAILSIDAGAGDDLIELEGLTADITVSLGGGGGADTVRINGVSLGYDGGRITTTGFDTGAAGDRLDIVDYLTYYLTNWDFRSSPFATGHLRLVQSGADAVLEADWDGGGDGYAPFVTFLGTSAASLTAYNLGGWPSDGTIPAGVTLVGDAVAGDRLSGGVGDDHIQGLGGSDELRGGPGDDHLEGGAGQDQIYGGLGDDLIEGGDGDDRLVGDFHGADVLRGGEGNDDLSANRAVGDEEWIELDGGIGNDTLSARGHQRADDLPPILSRFRLIGGDGADRITVYRAREALVDAGAGDDLVDLDTGVDARVTLGAGSDTLKLDELRGFFYGRTIVVTDFEAGPNGDRLDWTAYLASALMGWNGSTNPFPTYLRLVQSGADTLVQISGSGDPDGFWTLLELENVDSSALGQFNLGGFAPDGSPPSGLTLNGTPNADTLTGGAGGDTIHGFGANDVLDGKGGDDFIYGGDGTDQLVGGAGNDRLEGGADMDFLEDRSTGNDSLYGGAGRDSLYVERSDPSPSTLLLDGGAEGDWLRYIGQQTFFLTVTLAMAGGDGDDELFVNGRVTTASLDSGPGDDLLILYTDPGEYTVTLGSGSDRLQLWSDRLLTGTVTVTDFQLGAAGDRLDLDNWFSSALTGWDGAQSPFETGHARLVESGGATHVQVDRDGGNDEYTTLLTLSGISLFDLTSLNLGASDPTTRGTSGADLINGTAADDRIHAGPGNDFFSLDDGGDDLAFGGTGNDAFYFGAAYTPADVADGGSDRDQMALQGDYSVTLRGVTGMEDLILLSGTDTRFGDPGNNLYNYDITSIDSNVAPGERLLVDGTQLVAGESFTFDGSAETDGRFILSGGDGVDTLTGGAGADGFYFRHGTFWGPNDKVTGGANDQIGFRGDFTGANKVVMGADQITGVLTLVMMSGTDTRFGPAVAPTKFDIQMHDGNVGEGQRFTIDGTFLGSDETMRIDGSLEQDGFFRMFGGSGADVLIGGAGNDSLRGNGAGDQLTGNGGADRFIYGSTSDSTSTSPNRSGGTPIENNGAFDTILNFQPGVDKIDLSLIDANSTLSGDQAFEYIGAGSFLVIGGNSAGRLKVYQVDSATNLWRVSGDVSGDMVSDLDIDIYVEAGQALTASDFIL